MLRQVNNERILSTESKTHVIDDVMEIDLQREFTEFTK